MGRPDDKGVGGGAAGGTKTLALSVNAEGDINYDAVLNQSKNSQKWLQTTHKALVPKPEELAAGVRWLGACRLPLAAAAAAGLDAAAGWLLPGPCRSCSLRSLRSTAEPGEARRG